MLHLRIRERFILFSSNNLSKRRYLHRDSKIHKSSDMEVITTDSLCMTYYADNEKRKLQTAKFDEIRLSLIDYSFKILADIMKNNLPATIASLLQR